MGRFAPQYDDSDLMLVKADSIILATGQKVDLDFLGEPFKEEIKSVRGLIEVGEHNETRKPGVYAGGDAASGPSVAIKAIRAGANAARHISAYMGYLLPSPEKQEGFLQNDKILITGKKGAVENDTPVAKRTLDVEDSATIDADEAMAEAGR